ncbi:MAG: metallophosphoesterase [Holophagales bacterium]|nr:metallophosphoesterase [Holophagales bacterium]
MGGAGARLSARVRGGGGFARLPDRTSTGTRDPRHPWRPRRRAGRRERAERPDPLRGSSRRGLSSLRRLLHLSDIHFGPPHYRPAAAGVEALVAGRRPDLVIVSGDLTQRARREQFRQARRFLVGLGLPFLAVPGNHDVPMYRVWERLLDRYGAYRRHFSPDLEPSFRDAELEVVGFNTAFNLTIEDGRFTPRQLAAVGERFHRDGSTESEGRVRIAVVHHPLAGLPELMGWRTARRSGDALRKFAAAGVDLVLAGHVHVAAVGLAPDCGRPLWLVHSGTSTSRRGRGREQGRNTCNLITLDTGSQDTGCLRRSATVEQMLWSEQAERFEVEAVHDCALA